MRISQRRATLTVSLVEEIMRDGRWIGDPVTVYRWSGLTDLAYLDARIGEGRVGHTFVRRVVEAVAEFPSWERRDSMDP